MLINDIRQKQQEGDKLTQETRNVHCCTLTVDQLNASPMHSRRTRRLANMLHANTSSDLCEVSPFIPEAENSFYLRSTAGPKRSSGLVPLCFEEEGVKQLNPEQIVEDVSVHKWILHARRSRKTLSSLSFIVIKRCRLFCSLKYKNSTFKLNDPFTFFSTVT